MAGTPPVLAAHVGPEGLDFGVADRLFPAKLPGDLDSRSPTGLGIAPHQRVAPMGAFGV